MKYEYDYKDLVLNKSTSRKKLLNNFLFYSLRFICVVGFILCFWFIIAVLLSFGV